MSAPPAPTKVAIEMLTLCMEPGADARLRAAQHIAGVVHEPGGIGPDAVIAGLLNLNMLVLLQLVRERGATAENMLQQAGEFPRELSPQGPE